MKTPKPPKPIYAPRRWAYSEVYRELNTAEKCLAETAHLIRDADSFASNELWKEWSHESRKLGFSQEGRYSPRAEHLFEWVQCHGWWTTIGHIQKRPVCFSLMWNLLDGYLVCFSEGCSQLVDYEMFEKWVKKHYGGPSTDAMNFGNAASDLRDLAKGKRRSA